MRVAIAVIDNRLLLNALLRHRQRDDNKTVRRRDRRQRGDLQRVERLARVPVCDPREMPQRVLIRADAQMPQPALLIPQGPLQQRQQVRLADGLQLEHLRPRDERGVHEEKGIVRRGPDQPHHAALDIGQ